MHHQRALSTYVGPDVTESRMNRQEKKPSSLEGETGKFPPLGKDTLYLHEGSVVGVGRGRDMNARNPWNIPKLLLSFLFFSHPLSCTSKEQQSIA